MAKNDLKVRQKEPRSHVPKDLQLTKRQLKQALPKARQRLITDDLVEDLNDMIEDPDERETFRENLLSYSNVLGDPNITLTSYIAAIKYVSLQMLGYNNTDSWARVFPERLDRLLKAGKSQQHLAATVSQYNKGKVVNLIREQALVPVWLLNQDTYQQAINVQAQLMATAKSEKVRSDAANSLLTHLKQPEVTKMSLDLHVKEDSSVQELREATLELVRQQKLMIESGAQNAKEVAESKLITADFERVN